MERKWKAIAGEVPRKRLELGFEKAEHMGKVSVGEDCVFFPKLLGAVEYLPFDSIQRAYRREEDCSSIMGCCRQSFAVHSLIFILPDGRQKKLEVERREEAKRVLELLQQRAPQIPIGFVKEEQ